MLKCIMCLLVLLIPLTWTQAQATTTFQLNPVDGSISGQPGENIGWGFTIVNDANYVVITSSEFTGAGLGVYTDFIGPNFIVVGPAPENTTVTQAYDSISQTGIGSFQIDPSATFGTTETGQILLTYDLFSLGPNDPNFNPDMDTLSTGNTLTANASVTVTSAVVPIPGAILLFGSGMMSIFGLGFYKRQGSS